MVRKIDSINVNKIRLTIAILFVVTRTDYLMKILILEESFVEALLRILRPNI